MVTVAVTVALAPSPPPSQSLYRHPRYSGSMGASAGGFVDTNAGISDAANTLPVPTSYTWTIGNEFACISANLDGITSSSSRFCLYCAADTHTVATCFLRRNNSRCDHGGSTATTYT